jgi:hypothetical protein
MSDPSAAPVKVLLGVIDTRVAVLDPAICQLLRAVWDQDDGLRLNREHWSAPQAGGPGYGQELDIARARAVAEDETKSQRTRYERLYASADPNHPAPVIPTWSHGADMLRIACRPTDPVTQRSDLFDGLGVVAVQVPSAAIGHSHGVWLNSYVLDGLSYILATAEKLNAQRVVVNISLAGGMGGRQAKGHLPAAIDEIVERENGRLVVVMSAGNQRLSALHVRLPAPARGQSVRAWFRVPADQRESLLLEWGVASGSQGDRVTSRLEHQSGRNCSAEPGARVAWLAEGPPIRGGDLALNANHDGRQGLVAIHVGADAQHSDLVGDWFLSLENLSDRDLVCDAWIARNDAPEGPQAESTQQHFLAPFDERDGTLSAVARCDRAIVVGGYLPPGPSWPADMLDESGAGEVGGRGPDLCGVAVAPRMAFCTDEADEFEEADSTGTSVAAAFVTRRILLYCAGLRTTADIKKRLEERCGNLQRNPTGGAQAHWRSDLWVGPGP